MIQQETLLIDSISAQTSPESLEYLNQHILVKIQEHPIKLLYRQSRDGLFFESFRDQCFNKGRFLLIIKSTSGQVVGGYSPFDLSIRDKPYFDKDGTTFIFSLSRREIYSINDDARDRPIISGFDQEKQFYYFHFGSFDIFFILPTKATEQTVHANTMSEFPRNFDTSHYKHIPKYDDNQESYLMGTKRSNKFQYHKPTILELEIFGFEE